MHVIVDLECTCWKNSEGRIRETTEIGSVIVDSNGKKVATFQSFVKPVVNPILSDFCTDLTSIVQQDVDRAKHFPEVIESYVSWIRENCGDNYKIWSWGYFDRKKFEEDCELHNLNHGWLDGRHYNLKAEFAKRRKEKQTGMSKALEISGLPLLGTHHRGIDDALNISEIFILHQKWYEENGTITQKPKRRK